MAGIVRNGLRGFDSMFSPYRRKWIKTEGIENKPMTNYPTNWRQKYTKSQSDGRYYPIVNTVLVNEGYRTATEAIDRAIELEGATDRNRDLTLADFGIS